MRKWLLLGSLALPIAAHATHAQRPSSAADCRLARQAYDNPFSDSRGWSMRRYQWHAFYAGLSTAAAYGIHKTTKLPKWASAAIATVGIGLVPHIRSGLIKREYPVHALDWGFDVLNRSAPVFLVLGQSADDWKSRTLAATTFVGGYLALACYSSP